MSSKKTNQPTGQHRINRLGIGTNVVFQILIVLGMVAMVNYLGFTHYKRWDYSRDQKYALSQTSKQVIRKIHGSIRFIVFFSPTSPIFADVDSLLKEYQYAAKKKVEIEIVDPYRNFQRASELQHEYKFGKEENIVIVDFKDHHKFVNEADMAEIDYSGTVMGKDPEITAFRGEQAITGAVLEVTEPKQKEVAFLSGLGSPEPTESSAISSILQLIQRQNLKIAPLSLASMEEVPKDIGLIVINGARYDISDHDRGVLKHYWEQNGRIAIFLDPDSDTPKLQSFLKELGVEARNDRILRTVAIGPVIGILREVTANFLSGHPITKQLEGVDSLFMGQTQSLAIDKESKPDITITPLIKAAEGYWGETNYHPKEGAPVVFLPSEDNGPPLYMGVAVEKGAVNDERLKVDSARLIVVSNAEFLSNEALQPANVDFVLSSINWLISRDNMIGIAPKPLQKFVLNLSDAQIRNIMLLCMIAVPGIAGILGIFTWWRRRS